MNEQKIARAKRIIGPETVFEMDRYGVQIAVKDVESSGTADSIEDMLSRINDFIRVCLKGTVPVVRVEVIIEDRDSPNWNKDNRPKLTTNKWAEEG